MPARGHFTFVRTALALLAWAGAVQAGPSIALLNENCRVTIDAGTLSVNIKDGGNAEVPFSAPQENLGEVTGLSTSATNASWSYPDKKISIELALAGHRLLAHIVAENPGAFSFPILPESDMAKGWILPMFEGVYAPCGDAKWAAFLTRYGTMNTTADLLLPFVGLDCGDYTLTCIFGNPFNNELLFQNAGGKSLQARFTHQFTRNHPVKEYDLMVEIGANSPVAPAAIYRQWLVDRGEFVSLKQKIRRTPDVAKLLGAAHAYLWGGDLLDRTDVKNWKEFCKALKARDDVWPLLKPEAQEFVKQRLNSPTPDRYIEGQIATDLDRILHLAQFSGTTAPAESASQICEGNCRKLAEDFPGLLSSPETWGNGVSPKMVHQLVAAGFDRMWLGADGWDAFLDRPATVATAKKAGYLIGPYDSYNSVHRPGEPGTWETAQFDSEELYDTGAVINADGTPRRGFKKKGYTLSPIAAWPYVEQRVNRLMNRFHANSWFVDCDGFGQYFDDYSPRHPATQQTDMQARISRLRWINETYGAVIGTEGCSAGMAPVVDFAHGVMTPVIGWGDPDLTNRTSKYYLGNYYPPDGPKVFVMPAPMKEEYRYIYFEPRFRLPLFETVFHDSVVATHHWSFGSLKTRDDAKTVELMELLYNIPPLYHLNLDEFHKHKAQMQKHYAVFSPLHRELGEEPMTAFQWLTPDRSVQKTTFGDKVDLVANFGSGPFQFAGQSVPPQSFLAVWRDGSHQPLLYTP